MGELNPFKKPKVATPAALPEAPAEVDVSNEQTQEELAAAQEEDRIRRSKQQGRAATILSRGQSSQEDTGGLATKTLLGG